MNEFKCKVCNAPTNSKIKVYYQGQIYNVCSDFHAQILIESLGTGAAIVTRTAPIELKEDQR